LLIWPADTTRNYEAIGQKRCATSQQTTAQPLRQKKKQLVKKHARLVNAGAAPPSNPTSHQPFTIQNERFASHYPSNYFSNSALFT
jgi:hypothetical protein